MTTRVTLVRSLSNDAGQKIPVGLAAELAGINRTSIYYKGSPALDTELACKEIIDHPHTDHPTWEARQIVHRSGRGTAASSEGEEPDDGGTRWQ